MKGPSLDAIRKFKEQQERKKREEDEKKIKSKLSTLEHRAAQGDKKAKSELKKIEKVKEELNKPLDARVRNQTITQEVKRQIQAPQKAKPVMRDVTDFDELMRIAKQNTNQPKTPAPAPKQEEHHQARREPRLPRPRQAAGEPPVVASNRQHEGAPSGKYKPMHQRASASAHGPIPKSAAHPLPNDARRQDQVGEQRRRPLLPPATARLKSAGSHSAPVRLDHVRAVPRPSWHSRRYDEYEEEEEDDYESDGFVVDDEDDDIQDELRNTIRSVFRYDKRACDRREQELDRQYRAIGRVSTFEDLEREERRASRLAAAEDARALKEEEERKRLKRLRLKN